MPAATPVLGLPYPVAADTADVPRDIKALADKLDLSHAVGTTLPASPTDGQEYFYIADEPNGIIWHLRYRATASGTRKWEYVGGPPLNSEIPAAEVRSVASYGDLTTVGPRITVPLAGDYSIVFGATIEAVLSTGWRGRMSITAQDASCIYAAGNTPSGGPAGPGSVGRSSKYPSASAGLVITATYKSDAANAVTFSFRYMQLTPVRVG